MSADTLSYENAFKELNKIIKDIEQDNVPLDQLTEKVKRANELINFCKNRLKLTEEEYLKAVEELKK
ncbi:MAG: exodeoxyribonuclease VII small subunit [Bacteroidia bacterium]|nr:exodeoxyribonuclease VII small subunit [Bacteroidia bacterium]MCZ2248671.1 exodeoxyribonuclease VII small subunit [Bacteroidia bacterium]